MTQESQSPPSDDFGASAAFADVLTSQVNQHDVETIIQGQKHMMQRFEKTNEMLINCNALSTVRFHMANQEFKRHTHLLVDMKKDLDTVFRRIRNLKAKLSSQYPQAFEDCSYSDVIVGQTVEESDNDAFDLPPPPPNVSPAEIPDCPFADEPQLEKLKPKTGTKTGEHSSSCSQTTTPSPITSPSSSSSDTG